ncbi:MAG: SRPBCC domain-containing protein [Thermoplasmata archaeon]
MAEEPLDPILIQVTIPLPPAMIYRAWLDPGQLGGWMCDSARVDPRVGGAYELTWSGAEGFTSRGTITTMHPEVDLEFVWTAPPVFAALMNEPTPRTRVYVRLQESPEGIDVTLEHVGWGAGGAWEEARSWHFHLWDSRLERLKSFLMRQAYG